MKHIAMAAQPAGNGKPLGCDQPMGNPPRPIEEEKAMEKKIKELTLKDLQAVAGGRFSVAMVASSSQQAQNVAGQSVDARVRWVA